MMFVEAAWNQYSSCGCPELPRAVHTRAHGCTSAQVQRSHHCSRHHTSITLHVTCKGVPAVGTASPHPPTPTPGACA
jgi:hypothetical protein